MSQFDIPENDMTPLQRQRAYGIARYRRGDVPFIQFDMRSEPLTPQLSTVVEEAEARLAAEVPPVGKTPIVAPPQQQPPDETLLLPPDDDIA